MIFLESEMNMPAAMVVLPLRCTAVKTATGVVLISPIDFSEGQIHQIRDFGPVSEIVAPSLIHHLHIEKAHRLFPEATLWGPPGCVEKMPEIPWNKIFQRDPWPHEDELEALLIQGAPRLNEMAFLDKATRTLIVADFCFNLLKPRGWAAPVMLRLMGTYKHFAVSRLIGRMLKDRTAFLHSIDQLLRWDFDRVAMAHGEVLPHGGHAKVTAALKERGYI